MDRNRGTEGASFLLIVGLVVAILFAGLSVTLVSAFLIEVSQRTSPASVPLPISDWEPPPIPDLPVIESIAAKYPDDIMLTAAYGSSRGDPNWNQTVDLNYDGTIDVLDAVVLAWNR